MLIVSVEEIMGSYKALKSLLVTNVGGDNIPCALQGLQIYLVDLWTEGSACLIALFQLLIIFCCCLPTGEILDPQDFEMIAGRKVVGKVIFCVLVWMEGSPV